MLYLGTPQGNVLHNR